MCVVTERSNDTHKKIIRNQRCECNMQTLTLCLKLNGHGINYVAGNDATAYWSYFVLKFYATRVSFRYNKEKTRLRTIYKNMFSLESQSSNQFSFCSTILIIWEMCEFVMK